MKTAQNSPDRLFCVDNDHRISYRDAASLIENMSADLSPRISGNDVAIFVPNGLNFFITYLSVLKSKGRPALLNAAIPRETGKKLIKELQPNLVISEQPLDFVEDGFVLTPDKIAAWAANHSDPTDTPLGKDDLAAYFYTGGTTGTPKRVSYSHEKMMIAGARMIWGWPVCEGEVIYAIAPFTHIYGFLMSVCLAIQSGSTIVAPSKFHPKEALDQIEQERVTVLGGGPPAVYQALLSDPDLAKRDLSSLRVCPGGGAPFPVEVLKRWQNATGLPIHEGYGMTEIAPIAINTVELGTKAGSAGKPVSDTQIDIVDIDTGTTILPAGTAGEIRIKGPHGMSEYCGNPEESNLVFRDGWVYTGDIGVLDEDGFLTITDRKKDVILFNGFNVFPREVEEAISVHDAVANVCVVGKPDDRSGESVVAFVAPRDGAELSEEDLEQHCREHLLTYKLPKVYRIETELPLTPVGKLDRAKLRQMAQK